MSTQNRPTGYALNVLIAATVILASSSSTPSSGTESPALEVILNNGTSDGNSFTNSSGSVNFEPTTEPFEFTADGPAPSEEPVSQHGDFLPTTAAEMAWAKSPAEGNEMMMTSPMTTTNAMAKMSRLDPSDPPRTEADVGSSTSTTSWTRVTSKGQQTDGFSEVYAVTPDDLNSSSSSEVESFTRSSKAENAENAISGFTNNFQDFNEARLSTESPCLGSSGSGNRSVSESPEDEDFSATTSGVDTVTSVCGDQGSTAEEVEDETNERRTPSFIDTGTVTKAMADCVYKVSMYVSIPLASAGVVLNAFTVTVYVQPGMRSPCSSYLVALGIAQLLFLLLMTFGPVAHDVILQTWGKTYAYEFMAIHIPTFFNAVLRRIAFTLTFVLSVERCLAVGFPLRASRMRVERNPILISVFIYVLVIAFHVPAPFKYDIVPDGSGAFTLAVTPWWREHVEGLGALEVAVRVLLVYAPLSCTLLANVLTVLALRRHRRRSLAMQSTQDACSTRKADVQRTLAILVSTLLFVLLSLPTHLLALLNNYHPLVGYRKQEHYLYMVFTQVFTLLEIASNLCDFFVYLTLCRRFRLTFQSLFCRRCGKLPSSEANYTV